MLEYNPKVDYLFSKKIINHKDSYNQDESYYRDVFYKRINEIRRLFFIRYYKDGL